MSSLKYLVTLCCRSCRKIILCSIKHGLSNRVLLPLVSIALVQKTAWEQTAWLDISCLILLLETAILMVWIHGIDSSPSRLRSKELLFVLAHLLLQSIFSYLWYLFVEYVLTWIFVAVLPSDTNWSRLRLSLLISNWFKSTLGNVQRLVTHSVMSGEGFWGHHSACRPPLEKVLPGGGGNFVFICLIVKTQVFVLLINLRLLWVLGLSWG